METEVSCNHCGGIYSVCGDYDSETYIIEACTFCGSSDIDVEEEDTNEEEES